MAKKNNKKGAFSSVRDIYRKVIIFFRNHNVQFVIGLLFAAFAVFLCSSFISFFSKGGADYSVLETAAGAASDAPVVNTSGKGGAIVAKYLINGCFGWASLLFLPIVLLVALRLMRLFEFKLGRWVVYGLFNVIWFSLLFSFVFGDILEASYVSPGGAHGEFLKLLLVENVGIVGLILILVVSLILFMIYVSRDTISWIRNMLTIKVKEKTAEPEEVQGDDIDVEIATAADEVAEEEPVLPQPVVVTVADETDVEVVVSEPVEDVAEQEEIEIDDDALAEQFDAMSRSIEQAAGAEDAVLAMEVEKAEGDDDMGGNMLRPINPKDELSYYKPPTIDLLDEYEQAVQSIDKDEQAANANKIVEVLKNFGIEISSIKATVGPTITLYEITPAPGIRISKIRNLEDDIAMSLAALCIRIVAPIPGKGTIGIEVPNAHKQIVPMASLLNSRKYKETDMALPLALGKTISNEVYMVDMAKMPHLLVAGATGMGKSVGLNAIITSLLFKMHPAYLKFVMVDPKMVELSLYGVLEKHFIAKLEGEDEPIITDVNKVVRTLKSLCVEMDNRYKLLQMASVRSVKEYNEKFLNKELLPTKGHRFMPYIVVVIDEYGDLMMTAGREVEQPIARIAQKARAVGIHMIIATQRPTTNIITGTIKANFPARMAFRVISVIDSRTILDRSGANQLQGRGDMLFLAGNDPVRVQCALVETKEVERVCAHIAKQQGYQTAYILPEPDETVDMGGDGSAMRGEISSDKLDPLFADAARTVVLAQHGSTSLIQRKFNVGFNRAGRIMDQLCQTGIVGEQDGSKPRQVLCADEADLEFRLKSLL
ncbi:MAG: DNA translocase FtsK 4TM domain-containing protein [Bacteroidaceae bacterium]|nr:DNA translocase FtsK 4TM domain-containing protein [Bacteroidaceae bacterium]